MLRIGLTGGIASGKSTVARWFGDLGAEVIDADELARDVVRPGTPGLAAVVAAFGSRVLDGDGALDRAALGAIVFADARARDRLNAITHPLIAARTRELMAAADPEGIVVHDVPLLVEKRMGADYHLVVVVHADQQERVARLCRLRGLSPEDARARIAAQADDAARRRAADVWLRSGEGLPALRAQAEAVWHERLEPFRQNLLAARGAVRGGVRIVAPDPGWPEAAARLRERVSRAAGDRRPEVEHIGSTAVPGLPAKDVIDLQLGVPDLDAADALASSLLAAGFARVDGIARDTPHASVDADPEAWQKRLHASCDPGRAVNLHVRVLGGPGWRTALALRDWLRGSSQARAEYAALKRELAARHPDPSAYAAAKEPWLESAVVRAVAGGTAASGHRDRRAQ